MCTSSVTMLWMAGMIVGAEEGDLVGLSLEAVVDRNGNVVMLASQLYKARNASCDIWGHILCP